MSPRLFESIRVGDISLAHRVVYAPMTRMRTTEDGTVTELATEYYAQRAHTPGTLLIGETVFVAPQASGYASIPGLWTDAHIARWKEVVDAVHAKGSFIAIQIGGVAGAAQGDYLESRGYEHVGAFSSSALSPDLHPRALTLVEIKEWVGYYVAAAKAAVERAGADIVELHAANGDALEEFLSKNWNKRKDEYGGAPGNRAKFLLDVVDAVVRAIGARKVGVRISPWSPFLNMRMADADIVETYTVVVTSLRERFPDLAYLHVIQPRISAHEDTDIGAGDSDAFVRELWGNGRAYIAVGGFTRATALQRAEESGDLICFGRHFLANPDLVKKLEKDTPLTPYNRATFYTPGPEGYIDYPVEQSS
ncbi:FMN-linked oxidoreductase [Vararia minispora EC-137]|uniref:FMN-linked oxidoreductase n=1 Tax=Vararia minispora EC-137 TaxID=1314806 RepID=A0ACB8QNX0_9AGAM|nr:FMN-linked oxidoreductase [Vararia minispora EC-137]